MKRFLLPILAGVVGLAVVASVSASPSKTVLAPIILTPGDSQPITCQYALVGTLASPACPTPTATATTVPTPAPYTLTQGLAAYQQIKVSCNNGAIPTDLGLTGSSLYVLCPANTPTSVATAIPTATPSATPTP